MWIVFGLPMCVTKASRHPEVNEKRASRFESKNEIFAASVDRHDSFSFELGGHRRGVEGTNEPRIENRNTVEAATRQNRLEAPSDRFDFGELRHAASVAVTSG